MKYERSFWHDYREPGFYMLTLTAEGRDARPFGSLVGEDEASANIELTPLGIVLRDEILSQPQRHPELKIIELTVMEDHCHILLQITTSMRDHLTAAIVGPAANMGAATAHAFAAGFLRLYIIDHILPFIFNTNSHEKNKTHHAGRRSPTADRLR